MLSSLFTYRKRGGLHFLTIGRFGCSWYVRKRRPVRLPGTVSYPLRGAALARWQAQKAELCAMTRNDW
jgi:hypothetical protein